MVDPDSHRLKAGADYSYFATATYLVEDDGGGTEFVESEISRVVTLNIANDPPAIAVNIAPQSIATNSTTVALPFTVSDTESDNPIGNPLKDLSVTASVTSTNAALTPQISFAFLGTGANRSVRVIHTLPAPAAGPDRTVTVRLTVADTQCSVDSIPAPAVHAGDDEQHHVHGDGECHRGDVRPGQRHPAGGSHGGRPRRHDLALYVRVPDGHSNKAVHKATVVGPSPSGQVRTYRSRTPAPRSRT